MVFNDSFDVLENVVVEKVAVEEIVIKEDPIEEDPTEESFIQKLVIRDVLHQQESNLKKMSFAQLEQMALTNQLIDSNHKLKKKELVTLLQDFQKK